MHPFWRRAVLAAILVTIGAAWNSHVYGAGIIATIAGQPNKPGYAGDGGPALASSLAAPFSIVGIQGNLYLTDTSNNRIRKIDSSGNITTFAGTGNAGFSGDGGPATSANIPSPSGITADSLGNIYFGETGLSNRVRMISAQTGVISTVAGGGSTPMPNPPPGTLATSVALLSGPINIAANPQGTLLYIAESQWISQVDLKTGIITTICGNGLSGFSGDKGPASAATVSSALSVATDAQGNIYIADSGNGRIRKITISTLIIDTVAGGGSSNPPLDGQSALSAMLISPQGIFIDSTGNLYFTDSRGTSAFSNDRIFLVNSAGAISTVAGGGTDFSGENISATSAVVNSSYTIGGMVVAGVPYVDQNGNIFIAQNTSCVRKITSAGSVSGGGSGTGTGTSGGGSGSGTGSLGSNTGGGSGTGLSGGIFTTGVGPTGKVVNISSTLIDTDGDGFPDEIEIALGSSPTDPKSTPFGGSSAGVPQPIANPKLAVLLDFAKTNSDSITFSGGLPVPAGFSFAGQRVVVDIGGVIKIFTLDSKGNASTSSTDVFKLKAKAVKGASQSASFTQKSNHGSFSQALNGNGYDNSDISNSSLTVPVVILFNNTLFRTNVPQVYTSKESKFGRSK